MEITIKGLSCEIYKQLKGYKNTTSGKKLKTKNLDYIMKIIKDKK